MSIALHKKSTIVRSVEWGGWFDGLSELFSRGPSLAQILKQGRQMYLMPERVVSPPALPEPAGGVVVAVPGFTPHLAARLWGAEKGEAAPLVLLVHDWECQIHDMLPFVQPLLDNGARVLAFDAPAHGRSTGDETSLPEMAKAICAVAAAVGGPVSAAIAHGLGASALTLAIQDGFAVGRAVLLAPLADLTLPLRQIAHVLGLDLDGEHALYRAVDASLDQPLASLQLYGSATVPALFLHSVDDRIVPVADSLQLASLWQGAELKLLQGLGHRRILSDSGAIALAVGFALQRG